MHHEKNKADGGQKMGTAYSKVGPGIEKPVKEVEEEKRGGRKCGEKLRRKIQRRHFLDSSPQ